MKTEETKDSSTDSGQGNPSVDSTSLPQANPGEKDSLADSASFPQTSSEQEDPSTYSTDSEQEGKVVEVIKLNDKGKEFEKRKKEKKEKKKWKDFSKKKKILIIVLSLLVFLVGIGLYFLLKAFGFGKWDVESPITDSSETTKSAEKKEEPKDHELPLTGNLVTRSEYEEIMKRRPLGVIIENHIDARPQSGLNGADIVWEALAEGGISRFMPVFLENTSDKVGPVRSLRKYFLDFLAEMRDGLVMHIGYAHTDNDDTNALGYIYTHDVKALGLFLSQTFWRVTDRYAPHNAYASTIDLWQKAGDKGWVDVQDLEKWKFKEDISLEELGDKRELSFNWQSWSQTDYSVSWTFDEVKNEYLRSHNGIAHTEAETGDQIFAKNVILQVCDISFTVDTDSKTRLIYELEGEGKAFIFMDGKVIEGTWKKSGRTDRTKYYGELGEEIEFNRGRSWISVLPTGSEISY